ncbi:hypothetical protein [Mycolicibacterium sarraceniae]|uniref:Immunity repressor n=1 Tax=Mycolicibacterium sarraceniae TaxID=1534348 RepID=A0A7I7SIY5_9MYCO|nr:hypothetical protein [Mycolicibacterium sarraceniae]BBY56934.1 hypothetical protein MSAR_00700 [Mycolicibacterium sarraceniae]
MLQIAWINTEPDINDAGTAEVTVWDPIEQRIEVVRADTGIPLTGSSDDIVNRATELLKEDGWIVHSVEPDPGRGYAAIVELAPTEKTRQPRMTRRAKMTRQPLVFGVIEDLRRRGYNQSEIADMHGVSRQAVSWHKMTYGGHLTTRQMVNKAWPWKTTNLHGKSKVYQRLRDHGEYIATGGSGMNETKIKLLESWWRTLRDKNVVVEFDPNLPPEKGISPHGGFAYRERIPEDGDLIIRKNEFTNLSEEGAKIWRWPSDELD